MAAWAERLIFELAEDARSVLLLVRGAWDPRLAELACALSSAYPDLEVLTEPGELEAVREGSVVIYAPHAAHAEVLNLGRPRIVSRGLRVVLWCDDETTLALHARAPDFMDWVSGSVECPKGVAPHLVHGVRAAIAGEAPGLLVADASDDDVYAWLREADPEFSERGVARMEVDATVDVIRLAERLREVQTGGWVWFEVVGRTEPFVMEVIRMALALARRSERTLVTGITEASPGWWSLRNDVMSLREAIAMLLHTDAARGRAPGRRGRAAALTAMEPATLALLDALANERPWAELERAMVADDPGAALARYAAVAQALDGEAGPTLRMTAEDSTARHRRRSETTARALEGRWPDALDEARWWSASASLPRVPRHVHRPRFMEAAMESRVRAVAAWTHEECAQALRDIFTLERWTRRAVIAAMRPVDACVCALCDAVDADARDDARGALAALSRSEVAAASQAWRLPWVDALRVRLLRELGRFDEAIAALDGARWEAPSASGLHREAVTLALCTWDVASARRHAESVSRADAEAPLVAAQVAWARGRVEPLVRYAPPPSSRLDWLLHRMKMAWRDGDLRGADEVMSSLPLSVDTEGPRAAELRLWLARLLGRRGQVERATAEVERARAAVTTHYGEAHFLVGVARGVEGELLLLRGNIDGARERLREARSYLAARLGAEHPEALRVELLLARDDAARAADVLATLREVCGAGARWFDGSTP